MEILSICGLGVVAVVILVMLRQYKPEYAIMASIGAGLIILTWILQYISPILNEFQRMLDATGMQSEYAEVLLKALGICFITQLACDVCRDAGEGAVASKIEMTGKTAVLLLALPLFKNLLDIAISMIR